MQPLKVLDLFSGIGGFSLGLQLAGGFETVQFVEIDPWAQRVLAKNFPGIPIHGDIHTFCRRTFDNHPETEDGGVECRIHAGEDFGDCGCVGTDQFFDTVGGVDVVCGGFPCQPFSLIGKRKGTQDERDLWPEMCRVIGETGPRFVLGENVAAFARVALDRTLADLEALGYACGAFVIPACAVGAPHRRERVFVVAELVADAKRAGLEGHPGDVEVPREGTHAHGPTGTAGVLGGEHTARWWDVEPDVGRVANGIPRRVDRLRGLGNAVVPQVVAEIGRAIRLAAVGE